MLNAAETAVLSSLWKALEAQDVSFDDGENTWIDGHFEKEQLAFNFVVLMKQRGFAIVPREPLVEALAKSLAAQGHSLGVDNLVPIPSPEPWGDPIGEQPMWKNFVADAEATIDRLAPPTTDLYIKPVAGR